MSIEIIQSTPKSPTWTWPSIPEKQEETRWQLAKWFAIWFWVMTLLIVWYTLLGWNLDYWKVQLINMLFNVFSGLVGTILGFYFGQNWK